ncbi:hypothetical protein [Thermococcus kodakarensis]|nr:hypothetical protein [Thermococcus kodakarensis]WCN27353.1 hypothetical protein POG15_06980 [Thermococcus kodakarensis]WCN29642.1 hypothetical protein POG21_06975 [Thermococcus kodakarensis]
MTTINIDISQIANTVLGIIISFLIIRVYQLGERSARNEEKIKENTEQFDKMNKTIENINKNILDLKERMSKVEKGLDDLPTLILTTLEKELANLENRIIRGEHHD